LSYCPSGRDGDGLIIARLVGSACPSNHTHHIGFFASGQQSTPPEGISFHVSVDVAAARFCGKSSGSCDTRLELAYCVPA